MLRPEGQQRLPGQATTDVLRQHRPLPDGEDAGLGSWIRQGRHISGSKDVGMRKGAQGLVHADETSPVELQTRLSQPSWRATRCRPDGLVDLDPPAVASNQRAAVEGDNIEAG